MTVHSFTHLDLSYGNLSPYELHCIVESIDTSKHIQFLSLAGNKLSYNVHNRPQKKYLNLFNQALRKLVEQASDSLIHLDLSDMIYQTSAE